MKNLFTLILIYLPVFCFGQHNHEVKLGISPFSLKTTTLNYEYFPSAKRYSAFIDLTFFERKRIIFDNVNIPDNEDIFYREPSLDTRLGVNFYFQKDTIRGWGIGIYARTTIKIADNQRYLEDFEAKYDEPLEERTRYGALGFAVHYRWLIKQNWFITPILLTDFGIEKYYNSLSTLTPRQMSPPTQVIFELQPRIYIGYRF